MVDIKGILRKIMWDLTRTLREKNRALRKVTYRAMTRANILEQKEKPRKDSKKLKRCIRLVEQAGLKKTTKTTKQTSKKQARNGQNPRHEISFLRVPKQEEDVVHDRYVYSVNMQEFIRQKPLHMIILTSLRNSLNVRFLGIHCVKLSGVI